MSHSKSSITVYFTYIFYVLSHDGEKVLSFVDSWHGTENPLKETLNKGREELWPCANKPLLKTLKLEFHMTFTSCNPLFILLYYFIF